MASNSFRDKLIRKIPVAVEESVEVPSAPIEIEQVAELQAERMKSVVRDVVDKLAGDPDHAAEVLMAYLPPESQEKIRQAQHDLAKPLWQMLMGYVMVQVDKEEMWAPYILSQWETATVMIKAKPCGTCGGLFLNPRFPDAMYCCSSCYFDKVAEKGHRDDCLLTTHPAPLPQAG